MKKFLSVWLSMMLVLCLSVSGFAQENSRIFTDSTGRQVTIPSKITRIAVTGTMTQHMLFALAPDRLAGLCEPWDEEEKRFIPQAYWDLPAIGQLYGGKGTMNLEGLLALEPQLVLDVGESRQNIGEDMDRLTRQTGIPFVHIDAELFTFDEAFITLGELLGLYERAAQLADFCRETCRTAQETVSRSEKVKLLYVVGEEGLGVIARGSYQASVIDLMSDNIAVVDAPSARGTGNEVDMEQILLWDPECIIFSSDSIYDEVQEDPLWQLLTAVRTGRCYEAPWGPHNWMGFPPGCQRMMGLLWMGKLLYPDAAQYDLYHEIQRYFELFYHSDLSYEDYSRIVRNSLGKQE